MLIAADPAFSNRTLNPYNSLLYESLCTLGVEVREGLWHRRVRQTAVFHCHWPEAFLHRPTALRCLASGLKLCAQVLTCRLLRIPIVWTVHNLKPHEQKRPQAARWFYWLFPKACAGLVFLSDVTRQAALAADPRLARLPTCVIPHGHYRPVFPTPPNPEAARARLGLAEHEDCLLYFGMIRPYKNVPALIRHFVAAALPNTRLIVAGRVIDNPMLCRELIEAAQNSPQVTLRLEHVPDDQLADLVAAARLVVLPYREIANSGSAILALSLNRPVLAPALGSLKELAAHIPGSWLRLYDGELSAEILLAAMAAPPPSTATPDLTALDWPAIALQTLAFYQSLRNPAHG